MSSEDVPVGPIEILLDELYKKYYLNNGSQGSREGAGDRLETGDEVQKTEQQREEEQEEILQLADQARAEMRKAEQQADGRYADLEDEVRQNMGEIENVVKENEDEFEKVHSDVINAEVSGEGLSEARGEIEQMVSDTQNEFQKVERLASKSLEELERVMGNNQNPMSNEEQLLNTGSVRPGAKNELLTDVEQRIQKIEELAQQVTKLEVAELEEEKQVIEEEADFEQRFQRHQRVMTMIQESKGGREPVEIEENVFSNLDSEEIQELANDLEFMIEEAQDIEQEAEREPKKVEELLAEDEEVLQLLQDYVDRHNG